MPQKLKRTPDGFVLNEPARSILGGPRRKSVLVNRKEFPIIARRELVNQLLLQHDLEKPTAALTGVDLDLLRLMLIALEGAITNQIPAIRYHAILQLGLHPNAGNLNLLEELGRHGEDVYVRSYALLALGRTGLKLAGPTLRDGLAAAQPLMQAAAARALTALGRATEPGVLHHLAQGERRAAVARRLRDIAKDLPRPGTGRRRAPRRISESKRIEPPAK